MQVPRALVGINKPAPHSRAKGLQCFLRRKGADESCARVSRQRSTRWFGQGHSSGLPRRGGPCSSPYRFFDFGIFWVYFGGDEWVRRRILATQVLFYFVRLKTRAADYRAPATSKNNTNQD